MLRDRLRYRARDDREPISQQTASLKDLRDRIEAWQVSRDVFRAEVSSRVYEGWIQTLLAAHFQWYLRSPGTVDDQYWNSGYRRAEPDRGRVDLGLGPRRQPAS